MTDPAAPPIPILEDPLAPAPPPKPTPSQYQATLDEAVALRQRPYSSQGLEPIARQHQKDRMTVWERIGVLTPDRPDVLFENWGPNLDGASLVANGFNAWAGIFAHNGRWYGVGGAQKKRSRLLAMGEELVCLAAADDWLNSNETNESAHKTRGWLNQPPTEKQLAWLPEKFRLDYGLTRYRASALLTFRFNKSRIQELIMDAAEAAVAAADRQ